MSPAPVVPLRAVAALFLERQHLRRPRTGRLTPARLVRFVDDTGGLQLDSINVLDRAHYLTLWSRFGSYDKKGLDRLVYRRRLLFEYWAHAACLVPTTRWPWWRRAMLDYRLRHTGWSGWLRRNRRVLEVATEAIRANGPMGSADFEHRRTPGRAGRPSRAPCRRSPRRGAGAHPVSARPSSRPSTPSSGTGSASRASSASRTGSRSTRPAISESTGTTPCPSSTTAT